MLRTFLLIFASAFTRFWLSVSSSTSIEFERRRCSLLFKATAPFKLMLGAGVETWLEPTETDDREENDTFELGGDEGGSGTSVGSLCKAVAAEMRL